MLTDLNNSGSIQDSYSAYDVTVIGAGAAGITLALKLSAAGKRVALIEAGGLIYSDESQQVYKAKNIGDPYFELDACRLRYFGGSTNHWGGWCRPFEPEDFNRGHLGEEYKWPITFEELDQYREEACEILEISSVFQDEASGSDIGSIGFNFSPPVRFGAKYFDSLVENPLVHVFLNSNLVDVTFSNDQLTSIKIASYDGSSSFVSSRNYILAMGGIENPRYLLWFKSKYGSSFLSDASPIGSYWMEHPVFTLGQAIVDKRIVSKRFYSLSAQAQFDEGILNCGLRINHLPFKRTKELIKEVLCKAPSLGKSLYSLAGKDLVCGVIFRAEWEQAPTIQSYISLDTETDQFGIPKPILNWTKTELDRKTITSSIKRFNDWLLRLDGGRIQLKNWLLDNKDYPVDDVLGGNHHMGSTRMHSNLQYGVVDENCKVYGSSNLYVAGSSVFTTGGHNNPTLPIVQFALRLARHLST